MMEMHFETASQVEPVGQSDVGVSPESTRKHGLIGQLIGRKEELDRIDRWMRRTTTGRGGIVILEGEPGIGKTALLAAATRVATARGVRVLRGEAKELEQRVPFATLSAIAAASGERPPVTVRPDMNPDSVAIGQEMAMVESLVTAFKDSCRSGPTVLILDDVQWADPSSLLTLQRLGESVGELSLSIVLALRPLPRDKSLSCVLGQFESWGAEQLRLGPMNDAEVAALVEDSLGLPAGPRLSAAVSGAAGNPLYVIELVAGLMQAGLIELGEIRPDPATFKAKGPGEIRLPESLTDVIVRRLDYLPAQSRQVLPMAAALGPGVEAIELSSVLGAALIDVWNVISVAVEAGILVRAGSDLVFRHDLIRQVLADQLPPSTRTTLQLRAARVLMSMEAPVERVATYLLAGDAPLDSGSLDWLIEVAERLTVRAPELAVGLLDQAIGSPTLDTARCDVLRLWHVRALLWSGNPGKAEVVARRTLSDDAASAGQEPAASNQLHWLLAHACFAQGNVAAAVAVAESVLARPGLTPLQQGQYHGFRALSYLLLRRRDIVEDASALAISTGEACAEPIAWGLGAFALGLLRYHQGFLGEAQELGDRLVRSYEHSGRRRLSNIDPYSLSGRCLTELDQYAAAEKTFTLAIRLSESTSGMYLGSIRLDLARMHYLEGRWDDALADVRICQDGPDIFGYAAATECFVALVAVRRGTFIGAPESLPTPDDRLGSRNSRHLRPWVHALVCEAQGRPDQALEAASDICDELAEPAASVAVYPLYPDLARLAVMTNRLDIASKVTAAAEALEARYFTHSRHATAALCRGLAESSIELVAEAVESFRCAGRPWYEGQANENLAVLLASNGRLDEARSALERAIELYTRFEAEWDIARAEARLRDFGIRRGRRGPRNRPKTGWDALTPTERKVVALIAQGRSNSDIATRMFLSPRTVQSHVSSILTKLNLQSRVQVAIGLAGQSS
ncbi:helix-turn-helix transcriptional regulator [Nocardia sp. NBC_00403]|uniref:helix-turn-helix transcriptional regulator n=1 Tax=Nocardia sp. NBC_00403 TaxID=2975990 RepID=UPI002E1BB8C6